MSDVDQEREWWDARAAHSVAVATEAVVGDPSAWDGPVLERCLAQIVPALELKPGARILDLGCGMGRLALPLAQRYPACSFIGVDISQAMLNHARARTQVANVSWELCDGRTLPALAPLHGAYSMITLQHLPRSAQQNYIRQVAEQLVSGAAFRFQVLEGTAESFLAGYMDEHTLQFVCTFAGLKIEALDRVPSNSSDAAPVLWVTARKT